MISAMFATFGQAQSKRQSDLIVQQLGKDFVSRTAKVNGANLHYVRGGKGPVVFLIHGFPEDWSEFRHIMPRLAKRFTVVAVDLRGIGGSIPSTTGYEKASLAEDIYQLAQRLKFNRVYVAGHDIGGMVAYAFARRYPELTSGAMVLDVPLPGIGGWDLVKNNPVAWHFGFHQTPNVPEKLILGRQLVYFQEGFFKRFSLNRASVTEGDIARYAESYSLLEQLQAGLGLYRAFPADEKFNQAQQATIDVPIVLAGSEAMTGLDRATAESLMAHGCRNVSTEVIRNSGHYVSEEQPDIVAELIERYGKKP